MAEIQGNTEIKTAEQPHFDWEEFHNFLVGLQAQKDRETPDPREPRRIHNLPRVDPQELKIHKIRARRRRNKVKALQTPSDPDRDRRRTAEELAHKFAPYSVDREPVGSVPAPKRVHESVLSGIDRALDRELQMPSESIEPPEQDDGIDWRESLPAPPKRRRLALSYSAAGFAVMISGVATAIYFNGAGGPVSAPKEVPNIATTMPAPQRPEPLNQDANARSPFSASAATANRLVSTAENEEAMVRDGPSSALSPIPQAKAAPSIDPEPKFMAEPTADTPLQAGQMAEESGPFAREDNQQSEEPQPIRLAYAEPDQIMRDATGTELSVARLAESANAAPAQVKRDPRKLLAATAPITESGMSRSQMDAWMRRGVDLMNTGDLISARLLFERVAESGDPRGAEAMASTFDPKLFKHLRIVGLTPDLDQYERWRKRARELAAAD